MVKKYGVLCFRVSLAGPWSMGLNSSLRMRYGGVFITDGTRKFENAHHTPFFMETLWRGFITNIHEGYEHAKFECCGPGAASQTAH